MIELNSQDIRFAIKAVRLAAMLVKDIQSEMVTDTLTKGDKSPVTVADFSAQAIVAHLLQNTLPGSVLVGEESAADLRTEEGQMTLKTVSRFVRSRIQKTTDEEVTNLIEFGEADPGSRFWTLDPIDGTKGFLRGEQYAVAFALIEDGVVQIGAMACPNITNSRTPEIGGPGSLIIARRGEGAWTTDLMGSMNFSRLEVSDVSDPVKARLLRSFESGHTNISQLDKIADTMGTKAEPARMDSQAKYAILASGEGDILFRLISPTMPDYKEKIWDQAAGSLVCEEAGGRVTDLDGKPLDFSQGRTLAKNRGVVASNGRLHDAALAAIKTAGA